MKENDYQVLYDLYLADDSFRNWVLRQSTADAHYWEKYLQEYPEKKVEIEKAALLLKSFAFDKNELSETDIKLLWDNINERKSSKSIHGGPVQIIRMLSRQWRAVAASVAFLLISGLVYFKLNSATAPSAAPDNTYVTGFDQTRRVLLPDSSIIVLNPNSSISYNVSNLRGASTREIWLKGEAFFSVKHTRSHQKFLVHTSDSVTVEVLGTEFNLTDRQAFTQVVLYSGKVKLHVPNSPHKPILMKPGDLVEINKKSSIVDKTSINPGLFAEKQEQKWVFDHKPLAEVAILIEETFGYKVIFSAPEIARMEVSGILSTTNMDVLIKVLAKSLNIKAEKKQRQIILTKL